MIKDLEYILKKFIPEKYLLKKRLNRAIKKNYEKELEIIKKFSDKSKDALDIGVYRGVYSFQLAKYFKFVHSFEPNPLLFPYLDKNLKRILNNIQLYNYALSDSNGDTKLKLPKRSASFFKNNIEELYKLGAASIHPKNKFDNFKEVIVKKKKLDNFKISNKIGFIKIDVEGHEIEVINGAKEMITNNKPVLLVEIEERHTKSSVLESINYINKFGYNCFYVNDKKLISIDRLKSTKLENNYYCIPNI